VAQFWAGRQWGAQFIPRVGDEVIVAFLEGDPDQPIIIGSVYNGDNMPIYKLPDNKTQSGIKTHSSPNGTSENFNELRFEDKKGQEQIVIHAEKDMNTSVENNQSTSVGNNHSLSVGGGGDPKKNGTSTTTIFGDTKFTVTKGDYTFTVSAGTATYSVKGDVTEIYDAKQTTTVKGNQFTHVTGGHHLVKVDTGHASLHVDAGNRYVNVGAGFYDVIAATKITLTTGASSLEMLSDGTITLKGVNIIIDGSSSVKVLGGGADSEWKGSKLTENGPSGVTVTGSTIKLNS
jgi:type VI secretion system secreted protein VgrG